MLIKQRLKENPIVKFSDNLKVKTGPKLQSVEGIENIVKLLGKL